MVSPKRDRLDASTIAVTKTVISVISWLTAGLLEGYDDLLKEIGDDVVEAVDRGSIVRTSPIY
jgi:hypothetical protein